MRRGDEFHQRSVRANYGADLKGIGHTQLQRQRGLKGSKLGPASAGKRLSPEERAAIEQQMREAAKL